MNAAATPGSAKRLLLSVAALAVALVAILAFRSPGDFSALWILVLGAAIAGGEAMRVDLTYRQGGSASFTLGYAALAAGLLVLPGINVVFAAALGIAAWQLAEGVPRFKFAVNVAQYLAGSAAAALIVDLVSPRPGPVGARTFAAAVVGILIGSAVNTVTVGGMIAVFGGRNWGATVRQMAPMSMLLAGGSVGLGVLAVLLATDHVWALPTLLVPLALLHAASRREVQASSDREHAVAYVEVEQGLAEATDPEQVHILLAEGVRSMLGCNAAVWSGTGWVTPVPDGSGPCPVGEHRAAVVVTRGSALGPATDAPAVAVGIGNGVLVAWSGELPLAEAAYEWIERLGSSGRVHGARSEASAALRRERATLRAIVHGTADGIFVMDSDGAVVLCNPAMAELAQIGGMDATGQAAADLFGDAPWAEEGVRDVIRPDDRVWRLSVSRVRDRAHGDLRVAVVHDVTAERRVARMKDDMLSIVSHELRTPLTPIKGSAQLLRRRWERMPAEQREEMLRTIEQRADHLARLVEDLLLVGQMSSMKGARPQIRPAAVDVAELAAEATMQLQRLHREHSVLLTAPPSLPLITDPLRLRQIVDNLVNNACKFSPAGSSVEVRITTEGQSAVLRVIDQGRGIPPEDLERVFERFERVEDPLHMTTSGAGLGLYIVQSLARALGGDVELSSVLGAGTTVTIRVPLYGAPGVQHAASATGNTPAMA